MKQQPEIAHHGASEGDIDTWLAFANQLADAARPLARAHFRSPVAVEIKADRTPVTAVDREIEAVIRTMIAERFPGHGVYGEELGREVGRRLTWVIDPIDGTKAFITGVPLFGTLIALLADGVPVIGVLEVPALLERWSGARGRPSAMNGEPCATSQCTSLGDASLFATAYSMFPDTDRGRFDALSDLARLTRFGTDCYAYGLLASGHVDLVVEADMAPYDILAQVAIVEGAGGRLTDWNGAPLSLDSDGRVVAAVSPELHAAALAYLADASQSDA